MAQVRAAAALLIGVLPALQARRQNVVQVIKSENTGGGPERSARCCQICRHRIPPRSDERA